MSLVHGEITPEEGAVIDVFLGVSHVRRAMLEKHALPVPQPIAVRAQIDTGAFASAFLLADLQKLEIGPFGFIKVRTPSTKPGEPCETGQYDVSVALVSGLDKVYLPNVHAISVEDFDRDEGVRALIGRDVLGRCNFYYHGPERNFRLAF